MFINMLDWIGENLDLYEMVQAPEIKQNAVRLKWLAEIGAKQVGTAITTEKWNELQKGIPQIITNARFESHNYICTLSGLNEKNGFNKGLELFDKMEIKLEIPETNDTTDPKIVLNGYEIPIKTVTIQGSFVDLQKNVFSKKLTYNLVYYKNENVFVCRELSILDIQAIKNLEVTIRNSIDTSTQELKNQINSRLDQINQEFTQKTQEKFQTIDRQFETFKIEKTQQLQQYNQDLQQSVETAKTASQEITKQLDSLKNIKQEMLADVEKYKVTTKQEVIEHADKYFEEKNRSLKATEDELKQSINLAKQTNTQMQESLTEYNKTKETIKQELVSKQNEGIERVKQKGTEVEAELRELFRKLETQTLEVPTLTEFWQGV